MSDHCERTPPVWLAASLLCRSAHGVYHSLPSFIPPWGECVTRKERERHGHSQEAWKKEGVSEDFCHDHFPIFLMPPSLASPVSGEGQWTSDVWRVLTAYFSLIIVTTVLSGPFRHDHQSQRLSHEIDGVRKEKERLTASYTPRRFTLFTFVPDVTQGSYGKDSSAGRLTLHHCICRSRWMALGTTGSG